METRLQEPLMIQTQPQAENNFVNNDIKRAIFFWILLQEPLMIQTQPQVEENFVDK